jgi:osmoprotectant transport system permease protein
VSFLGEVLRWFSNPAHWQGANGIPTRLGEHVVMSLVATAVAALVALPIGLLLGHYGVGGALAINISNIGRAIPSFAILVLMVQLVGIGATPAFIALVVLAVPPIVTNSFVGMRDVDPELRDAARGLGFRESRTMLQVELPTAMPVVMAGIRTAGVQVVATATVAALVGWGGLGRYIVDGIATRDFVQVFAGAVLVALLAAVAEIGLALLQYTLTPAGLRLRVRQERQAAAAAAAQGEPA